MSATVQGATPDEIAVTGVDGAVWAEGSHGWFSLGGLALGAPAVASIPNPDGTDYAFPSSLSRARTTACGSVT